jgi:hypothetical protein
MKKFRLNWQSVAAGLALCAALGVFAGSKIAEPQGVVPVQGRTLQRAATLADVYDRTVVLEAKIAALEEHLKAIEKKIDDTYHEVYYRLPK